MRARVRGRTIMETALRALGRDFSVLRADPEAQGPTLAARRRRLKRGPASDQAPVGRLGGVHGVLTVRLVDRNVLDRPEPEAAPEGGQVVTQPGPRGQAP